jgi:hypothetical protein
MASSWRLAWASVEELKGGGGANEARTMGDTPGPITVAR